MERTEIVNQSSCKVGDPGILTLKVEVLQTCFVIEDFGSNRTGIAMRNPCIESTEGFYFGRTSGSTCC